ncbi:hypothetical protein [Bradyrhizobium brasilense]|uniref:Uncharacterized protein n=2 Tax=Bradyrhizobium brasilense TaxID=1419277 RepID=A0A1G7N3K3_9BRAD|nr:hypothetical protein [Bradyrhizobium brasilense]SDF68623.1 hypothetical protein SAMN05216337_10688 [Bradyrhizobium brasilense]
MFDTVKRNRPGQAAAALSRILHCGTVIGGNTMLELLIVALVAGIGFISGYGARELISRRRRRSAPRAHVRAPQVRAANDDSSASGWYRRTGTQPADHAIPPPDELDGAVRDLLGELSRRNANPSPAPHRRRQ